MGNNVVSTAWHEAGHAVATIVLDNFNNVVDYVTVVPTKEYYGFVRYIYKPEVKIGDYIIRRLSGAAGEYVGGFSKYDEWNTAPGNEDDVRGAVRFIMDVCKLSYDSREDCELLNVVLEDNYARAVRILTAYKTAVSAVANELLYKEILQGDRIEKVVAASIREDWRREQRRRHIL